MATITILGGTGFVGSALATRLAARGVQVRILTRDPVRGRHLAVLPGVELLRTNVHDAAALGRQFVGSDVVINLVGILNERGFSGEGFQQAHAELTRKVVAAAADRGVRRLLQMSSLGADEQGPSHYQRSKGRAERHVRAAPAGLEWTLLRPSVIFGSGDSLLNRFAALLRLTGGVIPLARAGARFQPVWIGDVVRAFEVALDSGSAHGQAYDLGGPEVITLRRLVEYTGEVIGVPAKVIPLPDAVSRVQAFVMDFVPGRPFSTDNYRSLSVDNVCAEDGCARLGIRPASLGAIVPGYLGGDSHAARCREFRTRARRDA